MRYEYTAIPAPTRGEKAKDAKTSADRYALALSAELNRMAADGWQYLRADVLPSEERSGLTGRSTVYHNLLIFQREIAAKKPANQQAAVAKPSQETAPRAENVATDKPAAPQPVETAADQPEPADNK